MREPKRIPRIINKLEKIWETMPDLRLGQIMYILHTNAKTGADLFCVEDCFLEAEIDKWSNENDD
jgi:uncharacterized protein YihD (DUF1040 family)